MLFTKEKELPPTSPDFEVVICGSFRREPDELRGSHRKLIESGCRVISPQSLEFVTETDGFVFTEADVGLEPRTIEASHLRAMQVADFLWLHAPEGYVGLSAAMELGFAHAIGARVFSSTEPKDVTIAGFVEVVGDPSEAIARLEAIQPRTLPTSLRSLQRYYRKVAHERGYEQESPQDSMLLLTEEMGELARAIRKTVGLLRDSSYDMNEPAEELADVQLYLVHLANQLDVDLVQAIERKEEVNAERFTARTEQAAVSH